MRQAVARSRAAEQEARRKYQRVLANWASDVLALRRAGLDRPGAAAGLARIERRGTAGKPARR